MQTTQARPGQAKIIGTDPHRTADGPGPEIMAADTLEGNEVRNPQGENLGEIQHIMVDVLNGRVAYAVLSFGGVFGIGDKLFAIPWQALRVDGEERCFVLNVDKEVLKQAPGFDKNNWPEVSDPVWGAGIHSYYGYQPYW